MAKKPTIDASRYSKPANLPGFLVELMLSSLGGVSLNYGGGCQKISGNGHDMSCPYTEKADKAHSQECVAANRHPGQVGYSLSPPQEVRDEESSLRAGPDEEGEGQAAHAAACAAGERQRQPDLPFFRSVQGALLHLEEAL